MITPVTNEITPYQTEGHRSVINNKNSPVNSEQLPSAHPELSDSADLLDESLIASEQLNCSLSYLES